MIDRNIQIIYLKEMKLRFIIISTKLFGDRTQKFKIRKKKLKQKSFGMWLAEYCFHLPLYFFHKIKKDRNLQKKRIVELSTEMKIK